MFKNRKKAGEMLAKELIKYIDYDCIILGIPRGGAIIAKYVAEHLNKPWDIIVPRKIGAPFNSEIAIGAVTQDGTYILNYDMVKYFNISSDYIDSEVNFQVEEIKRRLNIYRGNSEFPSVVDKMVILTDDGIATGYTFAAAVESVKKYNPTNIVAAIPVAPVEAINMLKKYVEEIICLEIPRVFHSVGQFYCDFQQSSDDEIINLFRQKDFKTFV